VALAEGGHLTGVDIDTDDIHPGIRKLHRQRQPDISQPDDPDLHDTPP